MALRVPRYGPVLAGWSGELVLLRHAQTECTLEGSFCGEHDPPLSPVGRLMADRLADAPALAGVRRLWISPACRSVQTSTALADRHRLVARPEPRLRELSFGQWEGRRPQEVRFQQAYRSWYRDPARCPPPDGETGLAVLARAVTAATEALSPAGRFDGAKVALLTHKAPLRLLICHFLGLPPQQYRRIEPVGVSSITRIRFDAGRPRLVELGNVDHLPPSWRDAPDRATANT
ncbi:MAG TPA: histidine phosphatase family protein [Jatrophihabitans sp.]|nr:histidine phosphatase family protein [Jatrophihabitans sp.]